MATLILGEMDDDIWAGEEDFNDEMLLSLHQFGENVLKNGHTTASTNGEHPNEVASTSKVYLNGSAPTTRPGITAINTLASLGTRLHPSETEFTHIKKAKTDVIRANKDKRKVYGRKSTSKETPLMRFKYGRLFVTDVTSQFWCELQLVYKYDPPPEMVGVEIVPAPQVTTGKSLHLVRELQVEEPVVIAVTCFEDRFALKVLSLLDAVSSLIKGDASVRREIHIFGEPFGMGVFVNGIIDEIRCQPETIELEIVEFKTRMSNFLPAGPQKITHDLQIMLYKQLFDEMVKGQFSKAALATHFKMDLDRKLGKGLLEAIPHKQADTLSKLFDLLLETMQGAPFVSTMLIEYMFQEDKTMIGCSSVDFDEEWLREKLRHALGYWKGLREAEGVSVEECWKCQKCPYKDSCTWKADLVQRYSQEVVEGATPPQEVPANGEGAVVPEDDSEVIVLEPTPEPVQEVVLVDLTVDNVVL